jgi:hypothetical protein
LDVSSGILAPLWKNSNKEENSRVNFPAVWFAAVLALALAQGPPSSEVPRLADGRPNLGPPDFGEGLWLPAANWAEEEKVVEPEAGIPYQPWARALMEFRATTLASQTPSGFCLPPGRPRGLTTAVPMEMVQVPAQIPGQNRLVIVYEGGVHLWREVHMDGRPHPAEAYDIPTWTGHSTGRWEGDTLVVDAVGFNEGTWLTLIGAPHTEKLHMIERFTRAGLNTLRYEATIDDPGAYTRPWTIVHEWRWSPRGDIRSYVCPENMKFLQPLF